MSNLRNETIRRILWALPATRLEIVRKTNLSIFIVDKYLLGMLANKRVVFTLVTTKKLRCYDKAQSLELNHDFWKVDSWTN